MQQDYILLPPRPKSGPLKFPSSTKKKFYTNYYQLNFEKSNIKVYQYQAKWQPQIPADSTQIMRLSYRSIYRQLKQQLGLLATSGSILWGIKPLQVQKIIKVKFMHQEQELVFDLKIIQTKQVNMNELKYNPQSSQHLLQILNSQLKNHLRKLKMVELGKGKYFRKGTFQENVLEQLGLQVLRGVKLTICPLSRGMCLQLDICSRVLRLKNLNQQIAGMNADAVKNQFTDNIIITRYGNNRTFKIIQFDYKMNPLSEFYNEKEGAKNTFKQYFNKVYGLKVTNDRQPLIKVCARVEKIKENDKFKKKQIYIYLIPQFVSLTGMSDQQRSQRNIMQQLGNYTKLTPSERAQQSAQYVNNLNSNELLFKIGNPQEMDGVTLPGPIAMLKGNKSIKCANGGINLRQSVRNPGTFNNWVLVYSLGKNPKYDDGDADQALNMLQKASGVFDITVKQPGFITIKSNRVQDWISQIQRDVQKNGKPQIIVLFLNSYEQKYYGKLKAYITNKLGVVSQGIKKRSLSKKSKNALSVASKILLQMNVKIGLPIYSIKCQNQYFAKKDVMYGALSMSKGKKGYTLAFIGTTNPQFTSVYSNCILNIQSKQQIPKQKLQKIFIDWARTYYTTNKRVADVIILYRQGLSDSQTRQQLPNELDTLKHMVVVIKQKVKLPQYKPQLIYIVANKTINSRFFQITNGGNSSGKFAPKLQNPDPLSMIFEPMSSNNAFDFFLVAQRVNQGTATPTHYRVAFNESNITQEALAQFTTEQCFSYFNWAGAVRVPACLQCANKLSKLAGDSINQDITNGEICKTYHFL